MRSKCPIVLCSIDHITSIACAIAVITLGTWIQSSGAKNYKCEWRRQWLLWNHCHVTSNGDWQGRILFAVYRETNSGGYGCGGVGGIKQNYRLCEFVACVCWACLLWEWVWWGTQIWMDAGSEVGGCVGSLANGWEAPGALCMLFGSAKRALWQCHAHSMKSRFYWTEMK